MLIATFGSTTGWAGKTISFENGQFVLEGHGQITASAVLDYDRQGHLVWAYDGLREWVAQQASSAPPAAPMTPAPLSSTTSVTQQPRPSGGTGAPKKRLWLKVAGAIVTGLVILLVGVAIGSSDTPQTTTSQQPAPKVTVTVTAPAVADVSDVAEPTPSPEPTKTQPPESKWVTVATLAGDTNKRSAFFELTGGDAKLVYTLKGNTMPVMMAYVVPKGESLEEEGGFPEVSPDKAGSDSTVLIKDPGTYYLDVSSANCSWTVKVLEKR